MLPVLARLVKAFNWRHQPQRHAIDLVAAIHVVLRMLHNLNSSGAMTVELVALGVCRHFASPYCTAASREQCCMPR